MGEHPPFDQRNRWQLCLRGPQLSSLPCHSPGPAKQVTKVTGRTAHWLQLMLHNSQVAPLISRTTHRSHSSSVAQLAGRTTHRSHNSQVAQLVSHTTHMLHNSQVTQLTAHTTHWLHNSQVVQLTGHTTHRSHNLLVTQFICCTTHRLYNSYVTHTPSPKQPFSFLGQLAIKYNYY